MVVEIRVIVTYQWYICPRRKHKETFKVDDISWFRWWLLKCTQLSKFIELYTWNPYTSSFHHIKICLKSYTYQLKCTWNILQDRLCAKPYENLQKFKRVEVIQSTFSEHNGMRLEINIERKLESLQMLKST